MKRILDYLIDRLDERSTWIWILSTVSMFTGATLAPEYVQAITIIGMAVGTALGVLLKDKADVVKPLTKRLHRKARPDVWTGSGDTTKRDSAKKRPGAVQRFTPKLEQTDQDPRGGFNPDY